MKSAASHVLTSFKFAAHLSQKMSNNRLSQLRELQTIIEEISRAIMWVNEREEEELMFDWGDKNIDQYIPRKQESYSVRPTSSFPFLFFSALKVFLYLHINLCHVV